MAVRIRYKRNETNTLLTSNNSYVLPDGRLVNAYIMTSPVVTASVQVVDSVDVLFSETCPSVRRAKTVLKGALTSLGVQFNTEVRKRGESTQEPTTEQTGTSLSELAD